MSTAREYRVWVYVAGTYASLTVLAVGETPEAARDLAVRQANALISSAVSIGTATAGTATAGEAVPA